MDSFEKEHHHIWKDLTKAKYATCLPPGILTWYAHVACTSGMLTWYAHWAVLLIICQDVRNNALLRQRPSVQEIFTKNHIYINSNLIQDVDFKYYGIYTSFYYLIHSVWKV